MHILKQFCFFYYLVSPIFVSAYPYYEAKRYQRGQISLPTSPSVIAQIPKQSYYNHYYKQQPSPHYYDQQDNSRPYIASAGFYNYPSHNSKYYGMPTYQGEYMPQPYYYAKSPKYSYYEDSEEPASNPLDDLQEEIRYEEQKDLEDWYDQKQREAQTNNFLRNLIAYNREIDEEERLDPENETHEPMEYEDYPGIDYDYGTQPRQNQNEYNDMKQQLPSLNYYPTKMLGENFENNGNDEVKQLNNLVKSNDYNKIDDRVDFSDQHNNKNYINNAEYDLNDDWISWERKRSAANIDQTITSFTDRKISTTLAPTTTSNPEPVKNHNGQKEKVLLRPANPRHLIKPVSDKNTLEQSSIENIYDTIKHLIALDKALDKVSNIFFHFYSESNNYLLTYGISWFRNCLL